jgi:hypothetical protein
MTFSRTAAIAEARRLITTGRHGSQWVTYSPHDWSKPAGPTSASDPRDYWQNRAHATVLRADMALCLMGFESEDTYYDAERAASNGIADLDSLVAHVATKLAAKRAKAAAIVENTGV